jgi:hypothetical protein
VSRHYAEHQPPFCYNKSLQNGLARPLHTCLIDDFDDLHLSGIHFGKTKDTIYRLDIRCTDSVGYSVRGLKRYGRKHIDLLSGFLVYCSGLSISSFGQKERPSEAHNFVSVSS